MSKGYVFDHDGPHHDVYQRKPFMNVEMHHHLTDGDPVAEKYYKDVWTTKVHLKKDILPFMNFHGKITIFICLCILQSI